MSSGSFAKREREKTKRERADRKREKRETRRTDSPEPSEVVAPPSRSQAEVLAELQALHDAHGDGKVSFDDFESTKADLLAQLEV